jgi:hypothetical protein
MYDCACIDNGLVAESEEIAEKTLSSSWLLEASVP